MATIRKRNNTYQIRVSAGYGIDGKQIVYQKTWKPESGMTQKQIEKELQRVAVLFEEQCATGQYFDSSVKFAEFSRIWLTRYAEKQLRHTTVFNYTKMLETLNQYIGHIKLEKLQPHHLLDCYDKLQECTKQTTYKPIADFNAIMKHDYKSKTDFAKRCGVSAQVITAICNGKSISLASAEKISKELKQPLNALFEPVGEGKALSGKTILNYHRLISSILETAVKWQVLFSNPCRRVEPPKADRKEARYLDENQSLQILEKLQAEPLKFRAMYTLLLYSGMRRGELCGLSWGDVDFKSGVIDINKSMLYLPGKGVFEDKTKNVSSTRSIKVPAFVISLLQEHRKEQIQEIMKQGSAWQGDLTSSGKVFTQTNGKPIHPCTVTDWFEKFIERHNLPSVCVHSLRHTNASLMIASGVDLRTVSKRLGHAQMSTTANIYTHAIRTADERASEALGDILSLNSKKA